MQRDQARSNYETKLKAVETYLTSQQSLRKIAQDFGIPHGTLWVWVRSYKKDGKTSLARRRTYPRRISRTIEHEVMFIKENKPSLTIARAAAMLTKKGMTLSHHGIWQIWQRYGLTKRSIHKTLYTLVDATPELSNALEQVHTYVRDGNVSAAADMLNRLPCMPEDAILEKIPESMLSPRRRLDRLCLEFGEIPFPQFKRKAHVLSRVFEKQGYIYSSIITDFYELITLSWLGYSQEKLSILNRLREKMRGMKDNALWFLFYLEQARTYCNLLHISKALNSIHRCRRLVSRLPSSYHQREFANLSTSLTNYKDARHFYALALKNEKDQKARELILLRLAVVGHCLAGEYEKSRRIFAVLRKSQNFLVLGPPLFKSGQAHLCFGQGKLSEASRYYLESLTLASKDDFGHDIYTTSAGLASVAMALNKKRDAIMHLRKYLPLIQRMGLARSALILKTLLGSHEPINKELRHMPVLHLLHLLNYANRTQKTKDYRKAFDYAKQQNLLGLLHRWIVFFPTPVTRLLAKGKPTGLPKAILNFPIFNQYVPVYHVNMLGDVAIYKNQGLMRIRLSPKEQAFLIHLALRASTPNDFVLSNDLCHNFWSQSRNPQNLLLHLLSRLKKQLKIPSHLFGLSTTDGETRLVNRGVYFTTDYSELITLLAQIQSLERAGEWAYARRDYVRAFQLLRSEPFKKMYDGWSEQMRGVILNKIENAAIKFVDGCLEHKNRADARKVVEKVVTIIPCSEEIDEHLRKL